MGNKDNHEYLKMEYEQTVQTLRNWDTLFFNTFSGVIIAGGIGSIVAWEGTQGAMQLKAILIAIPSVLYFIVLLYFLYNRLIAQRKFQVLNEIEKHLDLIGSYREQTSKVKRIVYFAFFPLFTALYIGYLIFVVAYT